MKRLLCVITLMLALVCALVSCGEDEHTHEFSEWSAIQNATCTIEGTEERTCSCGEKETKPINALGHTEIIDSAVAPTCTTDGKTEGKHCSACNEVIIAQTTISALGHTEVIDSAVAATCTTDGKTEGKHCSVCNEVLIAQTTISALGHVEVVDNAVESTCTETGLTEGKHCSVCTVILVAQEFVPTKEHKKIITDMPVIPTCDKDGLSEGSYCPDCNAIISTQEVVPAKGYDWILEDGEFKILLFGNSYTEDASNCGQGVRDSQLYSILQSILGENVKVTVGVMVSGGKGLNWHATKAENNTAACTLQVITTDSPMWSSIGRMTSANALQWTDWDVVSLQPYSVNVSTGIESNAYSDETDSKFAHISASAAYLLDHIQQYAPQAEVYCYMHWAQTTSIALNANLAAYNRMAAFYPSMLEYQGTNSGKRFMSLVPVGLSIQNARSTYLALLAYNTTAYADKNLNYTTDAQIGLQRDGGHVSFNIGRYIAALTFAEMIIPDELRADNYQLPNIRETESIGVLPQEYSLIAQLAVKAAVDGWRNGNLSVTVIEGYEKDPTTIFAEQFATGLAFACDTDINTIPTTIEDLINAQVMDDLVIEKIEIPEEINQGEVFVVTVVVRFGYTTLELKVDGIFSAHSEEVDWAIAPTCTTTGKTEGKHCSACNEVLIAQTTISALGHTEVIDSAVAATCTTDGKTEGKHCSVCNEVLIAQTTVNSLGHTEVVDEAVAPTCTSTGLTEGKHCSVCNETLVAQDTVKALGHTEVVDEAIAPTCTATGLTEGKHCSTCDEILIAQNVLPIAHSYENRICTICNAVQYSEGLVFESNGNGTCSLVGIGTCTDTEIFIPPISTTGDTVTAVANNSIPALGDSYGNTTENTKKITKIVIPDSVKCINRWAFQGCINLESVYIGKGVCSIMCDAFYCPRLTNIIVDDENPYYMSIDGNIYTRDGTEFTQYAIGKTDTSYVILEGVTYIAISSFYGSNLGEIVIPKSVINIDYYAFSYCIYLSNVYYGGTEYEWKNVNTGSFNYDLSDATIYYYSEIQPTEEGNFWHYVDGVPTVWDAYVEPENPGYSVGLEYELSDDGTYYIVTGIGTFEGTALVIPNEYNNIPVKEIKGRAFSNPSKLTSITIPENITMINSFAFVDCTNVEKIYFNATTMNDLLPESAAFCRVGNSTGVTVYIGKNVTRIPASLFEVVSAGSGENHPKIVSVIFDSNSVCESIGTYAFCYCAALQFIVIPNSIKFIDHGAFDVCAKFDRIYYEGTENDWKNITIKNDHYNSFSYYYDNYKLISATRYYYSETTPTTEGNFWHWVDGVPTVWEVYVAEELAYQLSNDGTYYIVTGIGTYKGSELVIPSTYNSLPVKKIGEAAFRDCKQITSVIIPDSITTIGSNAFSLCYGLKTASIGNGVTYIGTSAFDCCHILTDIVLGTGKMTIIHHAFYECDVLSNIYYLGLDADWNGITTEPDGNYRFTHATVYYCSETQPTTEGNFWHYIDGVPTVWDAYVEPETPGYSVGLEYTSNNDGTCYVSGFGSCADTDVVIPETSPDGWTVTGIGYGAFSNCNSIISITIPKTVVSVDSYAFNSDFSACKNLVSINVDNENLNYTSIDGVLYNKDVTIIIQYPAKKTDSEFNIPDSVITVDPVAFFECISIKKITIPITTTCFRYTAFYGSNINDVYYAGELHDWIQINFEIEVSTPLCGGGNLYLNNKLLTEAKLYDYEGTLNSYVFVGCGSIKHIEFPQSKTRMGSIELYNCTSLESVLISSELKNIDSMAFWECVSLKTVYYMGSFTEWSSIVIESGNNEYFLDSTVYYYSETQPTADGNFWHYVDAVPTPWDYPPSSVSHFEYTESNGEITITKYIGGISEVCIPDTIDGKPVVAIGDHAFESCSSITRIAIPNGIKIIGHSAFSDCDNIKEITLPSSVEVVGYLAFKNCDNLEIITIKSPLKIIYPIAGDSPTYGCYNLTAVFYEGTEDDLESAMSDFVFVEGSFFKNLYYYTEQKPESLGKFWHYVDGVPTVW